MGVSVTDPIIQNRPTIVLRAYWDEVIVIEETAQFLDPIYIEWRNAA
jgi:hypothetical protein